MVANWFPGGPNPMSTWTWEIGAGLGDNGGPLRDFSNPARTGDPMHMREFYSGEADYGGVHTNSNIHNFAVYRLLTATDAGGNLVFPTQDLALLLYLTLTRLTPTSDFLDSRRTLENVVGIYYQNDQDLGGKLQAVATAFDAAGITPGMTFGAPAAPAAPLPPTG